MPYVSRNATGSVSGIFLSSHPQAMESLPSDHPDIVQFFGDDLPKILGNSALMDLTRSDIEFIRVIEDVIDLLISKDILMFTDLPEKAREKILSRKDARGRFAGTNDLVGIDEGIF